MHFLSHLVISSVVSTFFFLATGSVGGSLACFVAGIAIDIDHVFECLFLHGTLDFSKLADIRGHSLYKDKVIVTLHSPEIVILIPLLGVNSLTAGIALGMMLHMLSDFFYYRKTRQKSPLSLFFTYRMSKGFSVEKLCS
jgi:hypothetical protein